MRFYFFLILILTTACGTPEPDSHSSRIVARFHGQPITWQDVGGSAAESNPKRAIDQYVARRIVRDLEQEHGITHSQEELLARARVSLGGSIDQSTAEEVAGQKALANLLTLEKLLYYHILTRGAYRTEFAFFAEEPEAADFLTLLDSEKDFERALARHKGRPHRESTNWFCTDFPPAFDPWILKNLYALQTGKWTGLERSFETGMFYVFRMTEKLEPQTKSYADLAGKVFEKIVQSPPDAELLRRYVNWHVQRSRIEYEDRSSARD